MEARTAALECQGEIQAGRRQGLKTLAATNLALSWRGAPDQGGPWAGGILEVGWAALYQDQSWKPWVLHQVVSLQVGTWLVAPQTEGPRVAAGSQEALGAHPQLREGQGAAALGQSQDRKAQAEAGCRRLAALAAAPGRLTAAVPTP